MSEIGTHAEGRRRWRWVIATTGVLAAAMWYLWPGLGGASGDVALITDETTAGITDSFHTEVRVRGRDVVDLASVPDWCTLASMLPDLQVSDKVEFVVIAVTDRGECSGNPIAEVLDSFGSMGASPVVVPVPGSSSVTAALIPDDVRTVSVEHLVGGPDQRTESCAWWDDCPPEGVVVVRANDGNLTAVGFDRMARAVASVVG
jgi:hypothetical protein